MKYIKTISLLLVLLFVLPMSSSAQQKVLDCKKLKTGKFIDKSNPQQTIKVTRKRYVQIEEFGDGKVWLKLEWVDDCNYTLMYKKSTIPVPEEYKTKKLHVEIIEVTEGYYQCRSRFAGDYNWTPVQTLFYR